MHQCVSEDIWFRTMLDIDVGAPPLPKEEVRLEFMRQYEEDSGKRLVVLRNKDEGWWEGETTFFDVRRSRAWVMTRRMTHTAHHRGQQLALLRMLGREEYSNYGPTADTGGLMQNHAPTVYAYPNLKALLEGETAGGGRLSCLVPASSRLRSGQMNNADPAVVIRRHTSGACSPPDSLLGASELFPEAPLRSTLPMLSFLKHQT